MKMSKNMNQWSIAQKSPWGFKALEVFWKAAAQESMKSDLEKWSGQEKLSQRRLHDKWWMSAIYSI